MIVRQLNTQTISGNIINNKIIPFNIVYQPTIYKLKKSNFIINILNNIKNLISTFAASWVFLKKSVSYIKRVISGIFKSITKPIIKLIKIFKKIFLINIKMIKFIGRTLWNIISKIISSTYKLIKITIKSIVKVFVYIKQLCVRVIKFILTVIKKIVTKTFNFITHVIKTSAKIILKVKKFLSKFKNINFKNMVIKFDKNGDIISKSSSILKKITKSFKNSIKKFKIQFTKLKKGKYSITKKIKTFLWGAVDNIYHYGLDVFKSFNAFFKFILTSKGPKIISIVRKIAKLIPKIIFTLITGAAMFTGIFTLPAILTFFAKWVGFSLLDMSFASPLTWRAILTAIVENMPIFDILFSISGIIEDFAEFDGPRNYIVNNMAEALGIKKENMDIPLTNIKNEDNKSTIIYSSINELEDQYGIKYYNKEPQKSIIDHDNIILNIVDELSFDNTNKKLFFNILYKHLDKVITILKYRDDKILSFTT